MEEAKVNMPLLGDEFPELNVQTTHGPMNIPGDLKGQWFVLFSHPADFTPVCTTELGYMAKIKPGRVAYAVWCDDEGQVIDDGTIFHLKAGDYRICSQERHLSWFRAAAIGMDVSIVDETEPTLFHDFSADPNRKLCRLHIALIDRMGVKTSHFGDAENALAI